MIRTVENAADQARLAADVKGMTLPFTVAFGQDKKRSNAMNRTIHKWFSEIATQKGDMTLAEVKADCNLTYGVPIKLREDPEWSAAFSYIFDALNRPSKCKALRVLDIPVTRNMTVPQLCEYMDQMFRDYRAEGFYLTDPELQRYQEVA
jgi:hypothetical protein